VIAPTIVRIRQRLRDLTVLAGDGTGNATDSAEDDVQAFLDSGNEYRWSRDLFRLMARKVVAMTRERLRNERQSTQALVGMSRMGSFQATPRATAASASSAGVPAGATGSQAPTAGQGPIRESPGNSEAAQALALLAGTSVLELPRPPVSDASDSPAHTYARGSLTWSRHPGRNALTRPSYA